MDADDLEDLPDPDLAQLLLLEAGRILEDLTPDLAVRLPTDQAKRADAIASIRAEVERACVILSAANTCGLQNQT